MKEIHGKTREEILYDFSVEPEIDSETLGYYLNTYPQYHDLLIDISIELLALPTQDEVPTEKNISTSVERSWEKFNSLLSASSFTSSTINPMENPLEALDNQSFRSLANKLNMTPLFLTRLRDRTIDVSTLPEQLINEIAKALDVGAKFMSEVLNKPPSISMGTSFKADQKPVADQKISFEKAIENSHLSEDQKSVLRAMKE